ncbi:hypothetical protein ACSU1N_04040 [Thermogladius sp. 4427co]|uniref:hypothetical protein n=1 Tax=Thermogladius sp. 4427co TaxID=3450718 RepID=UPI003F78C424
MGRAIPILVISVILVSLALVLLSTPVARAQGCDLNWWKSNYQNYKVAVANTTTGGGAGAKLNALYVYWDSTCLYLALDTNNTASWDVAYGFKIDVVPGGYNNTAPVSNRDSWGRYITYDSNKYGIDYEIYFYWSGASGITSANLDSWMNKTSYTNYYENWYYDNINVRGTYYDYSGDTTIGLQVLWVALPWSMFRLFDNGSQVGWLTPPKFFYIHAVLTGSGSDSNAVDSIPYDPQVVYQWVGITQTFYNLLPIPEHWAVGLATSLIVLAVFYTMFYRRSKR